MAAKKESETDPTKPGAKNPEPEKPLVEDRIEDYAIERFATLGYPGRLPGTLVATYKTFKGKKDRLHAGPLSAEGFVMVLFLSGLVDKEF